MRSFVSAVPLFPIAFGIAIVVAILLARPVARWLGARTAVGFLILASLGLIVTATLLPTTEALSGFASDGTCDLTRIGFPTLAELRLSNDTRLNLLLFIPLGVAVALAPRRHRMTLIVSAILLPVLIEILQLAIPVLGRGCQSADVIDNVTGLVVGLVGGFVVRAVLGAEVLESKPPRGSRAPGDSSTAP